LRTNRRPVRSDRDLDHGLQVHGDPRLLADLADAQLDLPEGCLDRGGAVLPGDDGRPASAEAAAADRHPLAAAGAAVAPADDHRQHPLEEDVTVQGGPVAHRCLPPPRNAVRSRAAAVAPLPIRTRPTDTCLVSGEIRSASLRFAGHQINHPTAAVLRPLTSALSDVVAVVAASVYSWAAPAPAARRAGATRRRYVPARSLVCPPPPNARGRRHGPRGELEVPDTDIAGRVGCSAWILLRASG
jgi:hypothetical protein